MPTAGTVDGWAKYSYDGTAQYSFSDLNVPVADWNADVDANDTTGLLTAALSGNDTLTGGALADELLGFAGNDELGRRCGRRRHGRRARHDTTLSTTSATG